MRYFLTALFLSACVPSAEAPNPTTPTEVLRSTTTVRMGSTPDWGTSAFPGPNYLVDGAPSLPTAFPNRRADEPLFERVGALLKHRGGFCTTCNVVFPFDGEIDPQTAVGNVVIVDRESGAEVATEFEWNAEALTLTVRPEHGVVLQPQHDYIAIVRSAVMGADGLPLGLPDGVDAGDLGDEVAAFTEFHTGDPAQDLRAVRAAIRALDAPGAMVDQVTTGADLDELFGHGNAGPGLELQADDGDGFVLRHDTTAYVITGSFPAARFLSGAEPEVGVLQRDADGKPVVTSKDRVPFVLTIPRGADLANLPVVVAHHGFNASRVTSLTLMDTAGAAGWAVLGIDAYQHGDRAASRSDRRNSMRDVEVPDGFAESNKLDVVARVFGFSGVPQDYVLSPDYALSAFTQFVADALSTIYFVLDGDIAALQAVEGLEQLHFDVNRVVYLGNSMGAVVGTGVIAVEPDLAGAVLNVMPGSIIETLAESGEFRPLTERVLLPLLGIEATFDETERAMLFDPTVDLFRWVLEPVDPLALATSRVVDNVLVQLAEHDEVAAPRPSADVVAAGGFETVSVYPGAMHGMMEVRNQISKFTEPLIPPLVRRPEPMMMENPTDTVHDEITDFLRAIEAP